MISISLAATLLIAPQEPLIAYVARYYYPPSDKRISHYQLYVSDLHGGHRRMLRAGGEDDFEGLAWFGRDELMWTLLTDKGPRTYRSKLSPFKPRLAYSGDREIRSGAVWCGYPDRGVPLVGENQIWTLKGLEPFKKLTPEQTIDSTEPIDWKLPDKTISISGYGFDEDSVFDTRFRFGGKVIDTKIKGRLRVDTRNVHGNLAYFQSSVSYKPEREDLYEMDVRSGEVRKIISDLGEIDFDPKSSWYAGIFTPDQRTRSYGPNKQVWASDLVVGNWKTGRRWQVSKRLANIYYVAVQPQ